MLHHFNRAAVGITRDPYFNQNVLLLHGDGTNGAQNNTFLDSSANNFTITRNGNITQGTFSPFSRPDGYWSNFFDGNGDYLVVPDNTALQLNGTTSTIEAYIYLTAYPSSPFYSMIASKYLSGNGWWFFVYGTASSYTEFWFQSFTGGVQKLSGGTGFSFQLNRWYHVAAVINSTANTVSLYIDGISRAVSLVTGAWTDTTNSTQIGAMQATAGYYFPGYISNLRIVKGTAVYTSNFTPPTLPLTAITNTSLLTCQSNCFKDNSSNNFAITRNGDARVQVFSPLNPPATYSTSVVGGSGYFDGNGDYLSVPANAAFNFGTGDFTVEAWIYPTAFVTDRGSIVAGIGPTNGDWMFAVRSATLLSFGRNLVAWDLQTTGFTMTTDAWYHVAVCRSGTTMKIFINGVAYASATNTNSYNIANSFFAVGARQGSSGVQSPAEFFTGNISNLRIVKGTALYTANFTPPTAPLTAITNTSLLLNFTNAGIIDNTGTITFETVGSTQCNTTIKKYGTGSISFNGTTDYLVSPPSSNNIAFGTGDFTAEFWVYFNNTTSRRDLIWLSTSTGSSLASTNRAGIIYNLAAANLTYYISPTVASAINAPFSPTANVWYHIALTRASGSSRLFINGVQGGSTYADTKNYTGSYFFTLGRDSGTAASYLNGYIDDLRITGGIARYTSNFTPPQQPFADF